MDIGNRVNGVELIARRGTKLTFLCHCGDAFTKTVNSSETNAPMGCSSCTKRKAGEFSINPRAIMETRAYTYTEELMIADFKSKAVPDT